MADFKKIISHVLKWEGGHSANPRDKALNYGHSGVLGKGYDNRFPNNYIHTNKGIIWATWIDYANKINMPVSERVNRFLKMTKSDWENLAYTQFWKHYYLNDVKSNAIAQILFEGYWGGGGANLVRNLQYKLNELKFLGKNGLALSVDGAMGINTVYALNNATKDFEIEKQLIKYLVDKRVEYLKSTSSFGWAGKGWTNRVAEMFNNALAIAQSQRTATATFTGLLVATGLFFLINRKKFNFLHVRPS